MRTKNFSGLAALATLAVVLLSGSPVPGQVSYYRNPAVGYHMAPPGGLVGSLSPTARYQLWSTGPRTYLSQDALLQIQASTNNYSQPYVADARWRRSAATWNRPNRYYPGLNSPSPSKPFANVRPAPNAFERYWPFLLEERENPRTGNVILTLP